MRFSGRFAYMDAFSVTLVGMVGTATAALFPLFTVWAISKKRRCLDRIFILLIYMLGAWIIFPKVGSRIAFISAPIILYISADMMATHLGAGSRRFALTICCLWGIVFTLSSGALGIL